MVKPIMDTKRNNIQVLRGLAIFAVVIAHHNSPSVLGMVFSRPFLNFSVGLFLFLSGMLSNADHWNPGKRIKKVAIPYALWSLIYVILFNFETPSIIPALYVRDLITGHASAIMYYVFVYSEFTLLMPLIDKLARSKYKYAGFVISPVEIIVMRLIPMVAGYQLNPYVSIIRENSCLAFFTYYYLGYLLGNHIITIKSSTKKLVCEWIGATIWQIIEGYWYFSMGEINCGTQFKLSALLCGSLSVMIAFKIIHSDRQLSVKFLRLLGDCSFGIYFIHPAVITLTGKIPYYLQYIPYPLNTVFTVLISMICVLTGRKLLGQYGKYFAF